MIIMKQVWITKRKQVAGLYVEWYDCAGRRRSKYFRSDRKPQMREFIRNKRIELNAGGIVSDIDVSYLWDIYLVYKQATLAHSSYVDIARTASLWGTRELTIAGVQSFTKEMIDSGIKNQTTNKRLRNVRAFARWCHENEYIYKAPKITFLPESATRVRVFTAEEIIKLLSTAYLRHDSWYIRILLALYTGLRRSDINDLRWAKDEHSIGIHLPSHRINVIARKTGKTHIIPMHARLHRAILLWSKHQEVRNVHVFAGCGWKSWYTIVKHAGVSDATFHDLRRTFITNVARTGVPVHLVRVLAGHANIATTQKYYIHTSFDEMKHAIDLLPVYPSDEQTAS